MANSVRSCLAPAVLTALTLLLVMVQYEPVEMAERGRRPAPPRCRTAEGSVTPGSSCFPRTVERVIGEF